MSYRTLALGALAFSSAAQAHVKWFEAYEVAQEPVPVAATLRDRMHGEMNAVQVSGDPDRDFVALMVPHHQSAVDMAQAYLSSGRDPRLRHLAQEIVSTQSAEIAFMRSRMPDATRTCAWW